MTTARSGKSNRSADSQYAKGRARRHSRATNMPHTQQALPVQAIVKSVADNHLICRFLEGNPTDVRDERSFDITVARPPEHRREVYDGTTVSGWLRTYTNATTRSVTKGGETTETQKITPDYEADTSIIEIQRVRSIGGLTKNGSEIVRWIDTNTNARTWAIE